MAQKYIFLPLLEKIVNVLKKCTGCAVANYCGKKNKIKSIGQRTKFLTMS